MGGSVERRASVCTFFRGVRPCRLRPEDMPPTTAPEPLPDAAQPPPVGESVLPLPAPGQASSSNASAEMTPTGGDGDNKDVEAAKKAWPAVGRCTSCGHGETGVPTLANRSKVHERTQERWRARVRE